MTTDSINIKLTQNSYRLFRISREKVYFVRSTWEIECYFEYQKGAAYKKETAISLINQAYIPYPAAYDFL